MQANTKTPGNVLGYVLAGGGSTRFGHDKALVEIDGVPMLLRMRALLSDITKKVQVIATPEKYSALGIAGPPCPPPSQRTTVGTVPDRQAIPQLFWRDLWTPRRG